MAQAAKGKPLEAAGAFICIGAMFSDFAGPSKYEMSISTISFDAEASQDRV